MGPHNPVDAEAVIAASGGGIRPDDGRRRRRPAAPRPYDQLSRRVAESRCTILLTGETGVGKGHFARWIHEHSRRAGKAFIPVNCGAIPESLVDSQLFGHARGAFSGATTEHSGLVRAAEGGTLFLDEVAELPASAQIRLLRLLQEREVQPVGVARPVRVDVRVVAATNVDLEQAVASGRFRNDLLYRLDVVRIDVPPLRTRRAEIDSLIDAFNAEFADLYDQAPLEVSPEAREALIGHEWPGNIRQLRTVFERLHVLCPGERVTISHLRELGQLGGVIGRRGVGQSDAGADSPLDRVMLEEVERVLRQCDRSVTRAAAVLGVHRSTVYRWIRQLDRG